MDIQPLPTTPNKTTSAEPATSALGRDAEAIEEAFESELLSWLAARGLEEAPTLKDVAVIEAEALDEPIFTVEGEIASASSLSANALEGDGGDFTPKLTTGKSSKAQVSTAPAQVTEEQLNVRKLVDYLKGLGDAPQPAEDGSKPPTAALPVAETEVAPGLEELPLEAEAEIEAPAEVETTELEGEADAELKLGFSTKSEGGESRRGFGHQQAQALAEAQSASAQRGQESQLSQASRRMMAELREKMTNRTNARLPLNLVLEEAAVPMRLRFQPGAGGSHEVAFVVSNMKARQELRRLMPEIETVLTELPVDVADVRIEIEPRLKPAAQEKRR